MGRAIRRLSKLFQVLSSEAHLSRALSSPFVTRIIFLLHTLSHVQGSVSAPVAQESRGGRASGDGTASWVRGVLASQKRRRFLSKLAAVALTSPCHLPCIKVIVERMSSLYLILKSRDLFLLRQKTKALAELKLLENLFVDIQEVVDFLNVVVNVQLLFENLENVRSHIG